jgi:hypothetical protein
MNGAQDTLRAVVVISRFANLGTGQTHPRRTMNQQQRLDSGPQRFVDLCFAMPFN